MLFVSYWELGEDMTVEERQEIAQKLTSGGLFPSKGVKLLRWDATADGWGVLIFEAERAEDVGRALTLWRAAGRGFFQVTKTSPALSVQESLKVQGEILASLKSG